MATPDKSRILIFSIIALALINVSTLGWLVFGKAPANHSEEKTTPHGPARPPQPGKYLISQLDFNQDQTEAYQATLPAHTAKMDSIHQALKTAKETLFGMVSASGPAEDFESVIQKIGSLEMLRDRTVFLHFRNVAELCNPEQRKKLGNVILETQNRKRPPMPAAL